MDAKEIIISWLKEHNCDGLGCPNHECGCGIDDLGCCDGTMLDCVPAKLRKCKECKEYDTCESDARAEDGECFVGEDITLHPTRLMSGYCKDCAKEKDCELHDSLMCNAFVSTLMVEVVGHKEICKMLLKLKPHFIYLVEVSYCEENPKHLAILFMGFHGNENDCGNYTELYGNGDRVTSANELHTLRVIRELCPLEIDPAVMLRR